MNRDSLIWIAMIALTITSFSVPLVFFYPSTTLMINIYLIFLIPRSIIGLITVYIVIRMIVLSVEYKQLRLFTLSGTLFLAAYILETLSFFSLNSTNHQFIQFSMVIFMISQYLLTIAPVLLMYFIMSYYVDQPRFAVFLPIIIDVILETIFQPAGLVIGQVSFLIDQQKVKIWIYQPIELWINISYYLSILWFVIYLGYLIFQTRNQSLNKVLQEQQKIFIVGIIIVFVLSPLIYSYNIFLKQQFLRFLWIAVVGRSISILGLMIFVISYLRSSSKLNYFQPQPLVSLHFYDLVNQEFLYQIQFKGTSDDRLVHFIAQNYRDLNSMLSEVTGKTVEVKMLDSSESKTVVYDFSAKNKIAILIVNYYTEALSKRFHILMKEIDHLGSFSSDLLDLVIEQNFGV